MILTDKEIKIAIANQEIVIDPFDETNLGCNSYDVHLGNHLMVYEFKKDIAPEISDRVIFGLDPVWGKEEDTE
jgi:deoxycytidine triphosphate deaminase